MARKRYQPEEIVTKLRQVDVLVPALAAWPATSCMSKGDTCSGQVRMSHKRPKLGQRGRLKPKTLFPTKVEASALSRKGTFGYNRPEFPGCLGKIGLDIGRDTQFADAH